ncbi:hypothetical protein ISS30_05880 [bacterium]|nr:hypothetical protein [bacterium]
MMERDSGTFCKLCGRRIVQGKGHYIVRIEVFAAGEPPEKLVWLSGKGDFKAEVNHLLQEIAKADPRELEDQVYKFFKFDLCRSCQREYIKNPLPTK